MFRNYFKVGLRNLNKNKGNAFINIGGLALGMAVAMTIGLWVHDELSYDQYHDNYLYHSVFVYGNNYYDHSFNHSHNHDSGINYEFGETNRLLGLPICLPL